MWTQDYPPYEGDAIIFKYPQTKQGLVYESNYKQGDNPIGFSGGGIFVRTEHKNIFVPDDLKLVAIQSAYDFKTRELVTIPIDVIENALREII